MSHDNYTPYWAPTIVSVNSVFIRTVRPWTPIIVLIGGTMVTLFTRWIDFLGIFLDEFFFSLDEFFP